MEATEVMKEAATSTSELERLYRAAQLYYEQGATQAEVAEQLKISRPSASRMLAEARSQGIVEIRVHRPASTGMDELGERLKAKLGLDAVHLAPGDQSQRVGLGLGPVTRAALAGANLRAGDVLLLASGETTYALAQQRLGNFSEVVVAPTGGGQAEPDPWHQTNEVVRAFAATSGSYPHYLFAPSLPSEALLSALQDDPGYRQVVADWNSAKAALVGIGATPHSRNSIAQSVPRHHPNLAKSIGDVCLAFYDAQGDEVTFPGSERMVRVPGQTLRAVPTRIAAAVGAHKAASIIAAANASWFNILVTDESTARAVDRHLELQEATYR
ncbi:sugar-binding transcriptional regulator [Nesterenkonia halotolerans]|uniref:DNA-binding transcriptional regulator LsrR (DeoR family) n=1 Tax=Nesterenkonia halotolerans TaxID=225325 RepID=A0ABR9J7A2_9MICC|nr:sugar-binding domain-containing protein [Nesterenkonia halotolerans]MBE1514882.1 DNA-binding transcriptional regulator LsrR (DeoR family) [Nesterenkonia halotolerans]